MVEKKLFAKTLPVLLGFSKWVSATLSAYQASFRKALCGWHTTYNETEEQHEGSIDVRIRQTASQEEGYNRDVNDELKNMRVCQN